MVPKIGSRSRIEKADQWPPCLCALTPPGDDTAAPPRRPRTSLRLMGSPPEFEEALRLRAGSLGIKAPYGHVGAHQQPRVRTVPLEASATAM
jgi:hypothetical protein